MTLTSPRPATRAQRRAARRFEQRTLAPGGFSGSLVRRAIVITVALKLIALILIFDPLGADAFQPPKAAASRVTEYVLIALLGVALWRYGKAILPRTRLHLTVIAFLIANLFAFAVAEDRYVALFGDLTRLEGLTFLVDMTVLYLAVAVAVRTVRDWATLGVSAGAATAGTLAYGLMQALGLDPFRWASDVRSRPFATFGNADVFAHFLSAAAGACGGVALAGRGRLRLAAALLLVAVLIVGSLTATRGFLLGLAGVAVAAPFVAVRAFGTSRVVLGGAGVAAAGIAVVAAVLLVATPLGARTLGTFGGGAVLSDRLIIYRTALAAFAQRPVLGWGVDGFYPASVPHRQPGSMAIFGPDGYFTSAHDWPLQALTTTGVLGLAALAILVASFLVVLYRCLPHTPVVAAPLSLGFAGYAAHALVSVGSTGVDWAPWLVFGGTVALAATPQPGVTPLRRWPPVASVLAAIVLVPLVAASIPPLAANEDVWNASQQSAARQHESAIAAARSAVALDEGRDRNWARLGKTLSAAGRNKEAGDSFAEAARRRPYHYENWNNLAVSRALQVQAGDQSSGGWPAALAAVREGLARDPQNTTLLYTLAFVLDATGDGAGALDAAARAIALYPREPSYDVIAAQASLRADAQTARRTLEDLLAVKDSVALRIAAARAEVRTGDRNAAIANLRRLLEREPGNREAAELLRGLGVTP